MRRLFKEVEFKTYAISIQPHIQFSAHTKLTISNKLSGLSQKSILSPENIQIF